MILTKEKVNADDVLQSPRQYCDLETITSLAEQVRELEAELASMKSKPYNLLKEILSDSV